MKELSVSISHCKEYAISFVVGYWQTIYLYV
jgi:phosphopantetheinyl transferase (holo-ACP synthase)